MTRFWPGLLLCVGLPALGLTPAHASGGWLRLQQLNADQLGQLQQRQRRDAKAIAPSPRSRQWPLKHKFTQQKQQLQALQDLQQHERAALGLRQGRGQESTSIRHQNQQLQRFRREQEALRQRLQMQRRSWPYRR